MPQPVQSPERCQQHQLVSARKGFSMQQHNKIFVGIDIAKNKFDVNFSHLPKGTVYEYSQKEIKEFIQILQQLKPQLICMEATGGLERKLVDHLQQHDFDVAVVNPRQIRDFAKAHNKLAKTDQIDAQIIAKFAEMIKPRITPVLSKAQRKLSDLTARRRQLTKLITQEKNRLASTFDAEICELIRQAILFLKEQLLKIEQRQNELIGQNDQAQKKATIIKSVPGLGDASAAMLIAELPELGKLNRKEIARLVGVAPTNRDSGKMRGKRTIGGGRVEIRNALYMPIVVAKQFNPKIKAFYERLIEKGKPKMVALMAAMRKLLTILNVMIREEKKWNENEIIA